MRAHAISHANPFIAHLAYVGGLRTNFERLPHPPGHAPFLDPMLLPFYLTSHRLRANCAAYFIGHITKDYSLSDGE